MWGVWVVGLLAGFAGCGATVHAPNWYPPQPRTDAYQGEGEASNCAAALERARRSLCEDIRVVVQSDASDARNHVLRQMQSATGEYESAQFNEVVRIQSSTHARCVFAGMPIREKRERSGGQCFVVLTLGMADYQAYLADHTVVVQVDSPPRTDGPSMPTAPLLEVATRHLQDLGYVVLADGPAHYQAILGSEAQVASAGTEFSDVQVATGFATWVLRRLADGAELERVSVPICVARGFSFEQALSALASELASALSESWRQP